ncbi:hypothetical protein ACM64Y_04125 [Novispirillum sp. DQ9]|uniref:hypothetical protein n=1 Tax=Novispirillum sp. DQ9 TaxID=3398612 RepID=UPI003C79768C
MAGSSRRGGIRGAIVLTVVAVLLAGLALLAAFNSLYFDKFLTATQESRLLAVAVDARDALGRAVGLGLPLAQFEGRRTVLNDIRAGDRAIVATVLYEAQGTGFREIDGATALPEPWAAAMRRAPQAEWWAIRDDRGFGVMVPVTNSFNTRVGLLAVLQSPAVLAGPRARFDEFLAAMTLMVAGPAALALAGLALWLVGPTLARLPVWSAHARALAAAAETGTPPPDPPPPAASAAGRLIDALVAEPLALLRQEIAARREQA